MPPPDSIDVDRALYPILGLAVIILAVGLLLLGITLSVTCETITTVTVSGTTVGCSYPFQGYALASLYAGALVTILAYNIFMQYRVLLGSVNKADPRRFVISAFFGLLATMVTILAFLVFGVG